MLSLNSSDHSKDQKKKKKMLFPPIDNSNFVSIINNRNSESYIESKGKNNEKNEKKKSNINSRDVMKSSINLIEDNNITSKLSKDGSKYSFQKKNSNISMSNHSYNENSNSNNKNLSSSQEYSKITSNIDKRSSHEGRMNKKYKKYNDTGNNSKSGKEKQSLNNGTFSQHQHNNISNINEVNTYTNTSNTNNNNNNNNNNASTTTITNNKTSSTSITDSININNNNSNNDNDNNNENNNNTNSNKLNDIKKKPLSKHNRHDSENSDYLLDNDLNLNKIVENTSISNKRNNKRKIISREKEKEKEKEKEGYITFNMICRRNILNWELFDNEQLHTMLEQVSYLRLSGEKIRFISNLSEFVTIKSLYLNDNLIEKIENINHLKKLRFLSLTNNKIKSIDKGAISGLNQLLLLDLSQNNIEYINPSEVLPKSIQYLFLMDNPLIELQPSYKEMCIESLPELIEINGEDIDIDESEESDESDDENRKEDDAEEDKEETPYEECNDNDNNSDTDNDENDDDKSQNS